MTKVCRLRSEAACPRNGRRRRRARYGGDIRPRGRHGDVSWDCKTHATPIGDLGIFARDFAERFKAGPGSSGISIVEVESAPGNAAAGAERLRDLDFRMENRQAWTLPDDYAGSFREAMRVMTAMAVVAGGRVEIPEKVMIDLCRYEIFVTVTDHRQPGSTASPKPIMTVEAMRKAEGSTGAEGGPDS